MLQDIRTCSCKIKVCTFFLYLSRWSANQVLPEAHLLSCCRVWLVTGASTGIWGCQGAWPSCGSASGPPVWEAERVPSHSWLTLTTFSVLTEEVNWPRSIHYYHVAWFFFSCSILIASWPWNYGYFKWIRNDFFFSSMCNLAGKKRTQLNFVSNRNVLHQLQIEAWPWFANFHRFGGCSASSQRNSWDMAKEQLFIEYILFQLPNAQIQGTFSLRRHWYIYLE